MACFGRRPNPQYADYANPDSPVGSGSDMSESTGIFEERTITNIFDDMAAESGPKSEVPSVSTWTSPKYDKFLRKCFKTCRRVLPCDEFISRTLFGGLHEKNKESREIMQVLHHLDGATNCLDTKEEYFLKNKSPEMVLKFDMDLKVLIGKVESQTEQITTISTSRIDLLEM